MSVDMFLKLDGVEDESKDGTYSGEIDILGWNWGATQTGTAHRGGGAGTGKVSYQDITVQKYPSKSTPVVLQHLSSGKHFPTATLICRKSGEEPLEYLKIEMENVFITSYQTGGSAGTELPIESVSLNFEKFKLIYEPQDEKGGGSGAVEFGWDIAANVQT